MTPVCLESERIAAYLDGRLDEQARGELEDHLAGCEECYALLAETLHVQSEMDADAPAAAPATLRAPRGRASWLLRAGGIAAVLAIAALTTVRLTHRADPPSQALADALGDHRLVEPRLTGGFRHAELRGTRSGQSRVDPELMALYSAAAGLEGKAKEGNASPALMGAVGVARLLVGDVDDAIATLEEAVTRAPPDAGLLSDLAGAYLVRAKRLRQAADWPKALQAAEQAVALDPGRAEAEFNRALALEGLSLHEQARAAWQRYLSLDSSSGWADEARKHLAALGGMTRHDKQSELTTAVTQMRAALDEPADQRSDAALRAAVARAPQAAYDYFEQELLAEWGAAYLAGEGAGGFQAKAIRLGQVLAAEDSLAADTVSGLADEDGSRHRALAGGYVAYGRGKAAYDQGRFGDALASLQEAKVELSRVRSPFAMLPDLYVAVVLGPSKPQAAGAILDRLATLARTGGHGRTLGRVLWIRGLLWGTQARLSAALADYAEAHQAFTSVGSVDEAIPLHGMTAEALDLLGDEKAAWTHRLLALQRLGDISSGRRRHVLLLQATWASLNQALPEVSLRFADELLRVDRAWGDAAGIAEGYRVHARVCGRLERRAELEADLSEARRWLKRSPADEQRMADYAANAAAVEGELASRTRPAAAIPALDRAIQHFQDAGMQVRLPPLYLFRGRAHAALGQDAPAEADFLQGIQLFEDARRAVARERQVPFFDDAWELFDEMIGLQVRGEDSDTALAFAERARARQLLDALAGPISLPPEGPRSFPRATIQPMTPAELQRTLPEGVTLVYYTLLTDRLLTWALTTTGREFFESPLSASELRRRVGRYRAALERPGPAGTDGLDALATGLGRALLDPLAPILKQGTAIVFVPDDVLQRLPFGALRSPATGRYLVEDHAIGMTPSGTVFAHASSYKGGDGDLSALVVGNPLAAVRPGEWRPDLPHAEAEAAEVAAMYPSAELLSRQAATRAHFLDRLEHHDLIHFGGHAVAESQVYSTSHLLLTPEAGVPGSGDLFLHEVPPGRLRRARLFVLAACSTAAGPLSRSEGALSLARPLLAQGVPTVVASLWDVDDEASRRLLVAFHRYYRDTRSPLEALRAAQLALLNGPEGRFRHPNAWAAFVSIGGDPTGWRPLPGTAHLGRPAGPWRAQRPRSSYQGGR